MSKLQRLEAYATLLSGVSSDLSMAFLTGYPNYFGLTPDPWHPLCNQRGAIVWLV